MVERAGERWEDGKEDAAVRERRAMTFEAVVAKPGAGQMRVSQIGCNPATAIIFLHSHSIRNKLHGVTLCAPSLSAHCAASPIPRSSSGPNV